MVPRLLASGRLPHAMLLTGVDALGKRSLAFAMAKAILSAGLPISESEMTAPQPPRAQRQVPGEPDEEPDLFGGEDEPDLFGDLGGEDAGKKEEPKAAEPRKEPKPAKSKESKSKKKAAKEQPAEKAQKKPVAPDLPRQGARAALRATFRGFDPRVCRLVESSYPVEYTKDNRPANLSCMDLSIVEPIGGRRGILVDQIRNLQQIANMPPVEGKFRVVLVFGADTITAEGGNSILKLLEEPPSYLVMILVANQESAVLPTIRSRCTVVPMNPLDQETLEEKLVDEEKMDHERARVAASLSEGRPGVALQAVKADLLERRREVFEARLQLDRFGTAALAASAARIQSAGKLDESLWLLLSFARDRLVRATAPERPELLIHGDALDLVDAVDEDPAVLDAEAVRLLDSYDLLRHPFLPNQRAALQLALWPENPVSC